ncbi:MAG: hypothetical protein V1895_00695 [Parcubacteria group bacterium]
MKVRTRILLAGITLCALVLAQLPGGLPVQQALAVQTPENDDIFDVEAYNGAREDELEVRPLGEFFPAFDFGFDYNFDVDVSGGGLFGGADADVSTELQETLDPLFTSEEQSDKRASQVRTPRANIQLSSVGLEPGSELSATAQPEAFDQQGSGENLFYAWALDAVHLGGVAAGADPLDLPSASSPRAEHSRPTRTDSDRDGMDDDWEVRYGLNPNDAGDAGQDPDQDSYTNDVYHNKLEEVLIVEPPTSAGEPGGSLTNLEEYIWGTDPTNPDTDGDGFTDGQDIAGLGQVQIKLAVPLEAELNASPTLRLTMLGNSLQKFSDGTPLVKLDSTTVPLTVRDAERLDVSIRTSNDAPVPGEQLTLTAILGRTDYQPGILTYTWSVNNVVQEAGSGESAVAFEYTVPEDTQPGDVLVCGVQAVNFETRQQADATLEVRVGELLQLHYDTKDVVSGKEVTVTASLAHEADSSKLVFHWTLDGQPVESESGQGKTTLTTEVPGSPGQKHEVGVKVTTPEDSKLIAESMTTLSVQQPAVEIVFEPTEVRLGEELTLIAIPKFFSTQELQYDWSIDGQPIVTASQSSSVSVLPDAVGRHEATVRARSLGSRAQSVSTRADFTVLPPTAAATTVFEKRAQTLAQLRTALIERPKALGIFMGVFIAGLAIVTLLLFKRNALS